MLVLKLLIRLVKVIVIVVVGFVLVTAGRVVHASTHDGRGPADVILVMGASQINGRPSPVLRARLDHAQDLYADGVAPRIITAGGRLSSQEMAEAQAGRTYLVKAGVPADAVIAVARGTDTRRELIAADELMQERGWRTAVIVSDPWHSLRVVSVAKSAGIRGEASPTRTGPANGSLTQRTRYVARETAAYAAWSLFGRRFDAPGRQL